ncbi:MAG: helix-turn-helix domain-containing protein [Janthinobacterium lividum]
MDTITLSRAEYQDIIDARDHAVAMRDVATGAVETLSEAELDAYLDAATPLAFWRKHRGMTQTALATQADVSQAFLAQIEAGKRVGSVSVLAKVAKALRVRIEDLLAE